MHHIALFGEVLADIFPDKTILGGAPYNVTRHLRALQQHPILISRVGNDDLKNQLFNELVQLDINASSIQLDAANPTGKVAVAMKDGVHHFDICPNQAYDYIDANDALQTTKPYKLSMTYFGTLAQRNRTSKSALETFLKRDSNTKFLDINLRAPWFDRAAVAFSLLNANIVKVSEEELAVVATLFENSTESLHTFASYLIETFNLTTLYITCGEHGAWALTSAGEKLHVRGQNLKSSMVDTVGAGDAFSAIAILGDLYKWPIEKTLSKANAFAAEICKVRGAYPSTSDLYQRTLENLPTN